MLSQARFTTDGSCVQSLSMRLPQAAIEKYSEGIDLAPMDCPLTF